jgi:threonine efflux protein
LSVPFFVSFYLAEPSFRTAFGNVIVCGVIFLMALSWFTAIGRIFSISSLQSADAKWRDKARYALAIKMGIFALKVLYETLF